MGARRVADTSPAHVDWFDYLVVKTALLPRAARREIWADLQAGGVLGWCEGAAPSSRASQARVLLLNEHHRELERSGRVVPDTSRPVSGGRAIHGHDAIDQAPTDCA
jgi:hypothetical protein